MITMIAGDEEIIKDKVNDTWLVDDCNNHVLKQQQQWASASLIVKVFAAAANLSKSKPGKPGTWFVRAYQIKTKQKL